MFSMGYFLFKIFNDNINNDNSKNNDEWINFNVWKLDLTKENNKAFL